MDEGNLVSYGLSRAIERYDPTREMKFDTYAAKRIKRQIIHELRSRDWDDSGEGGGGAGVREPRRPLLRAPSVGDVVDPAA